MLPNIVKPKTAVTFLQKGIQLIAERGRQYQRKGKQECSFPKIATAFNAITGHNLTSAEVALLLQILKDVRQFSQDRYHADSIEDCISYAALKGEELYKQYNQEE